MRQWRGHLIAVVAFFTIFSLLCSVDGCGDTLIDENFNEYNGNYRPWLEEEAKDTWPRGPARPDANGVPRAPGFIFGRGFERADVGEGNLRLLHPEGGVGTRETGLIFDVRLPEPILEATLSYRFKFESGYGWTRGGKLPGMCSEGCPSGCGPIGPDDGWNARIMWRDSGSLMNYMGWFDKQDNCADNWRWGVNAVDGEWHDLKMYIKVNSDGGAKDGILRVYLDEELVEERTNHNLASSHAHQIEKLTFRNFHGGSDEKWAPPRDQYIFFDNLKLQEGACGVGDVPPSSPPPSSPPPSSPLPSSPPPSDVITVPCENGVGPVQKFKRCSGQDSGQRFYYECAQGLMCVEKNKFYSQCRDDIDVRKADEWSLRILECE